MSELRIYAACLASYNNGRLYGAWIDCQGKDSEALNAEIQAMLKASPMPLAEEWAIHDHEGFSGMIKSEYPALSDIAAIAEALDSDSEHERAGFRYLVSELGYSIEDGAKQAEDVMIFQSDSWDLAKAYAEEYVGETIDLESLPELIRYNIDYESIGRDLTMGGDVNEYNDSELGRVLITNASSF